MFNGQRIIAIIPARGGSKGIKDKNIKLLNGKPLICYTISSALKSKYIDYVMVNTDSKTIADISRENGAQVPFLRPLELAKDESKTIDSILYCIKKLNELNQHFDELILLQPTSPCRTNNHIDQAIELYYKSNKASLLSINEIKGFNPFLIRRIDKNFSTINIVKSSSTIRRQDVPTYYKVNGAIYINQIAQITSQTSFNDNKIGYIMDSDCSIDIDSLDDFNLAEKILK